MSNNSKGFTLIELMIVVVIIGILAAIAIPNFVAMQARAREASVTSNMHSFQLAIEDFSVKNTGRYPVAVDDVAVKANMPSGNYPRNPFSGFNDAWRQSGYGDHLCHQRLRTVVAYSPHADERLASGWKASTGEARRDRRQLAGSR